MSARRSRILMCFASVGPQSRVRSERQGPRRSPRHSGHCPGRICLQGARVDGPGSRAADSVRIGAKGGEACVLSIRTGANARILP